MVALSVARPPLTRHEARQRADLVEVESYDVSLDLRERPGGRFGTVTNVRCHARRRGVTFIEVPDATAAVILDGRQVPYAGGRAELHLTPGPHRLVVEGEGIYSADGAGLHRARDGADGRTYVYANSALAAGSRWFACFDQPDLKARLGVRAALPDGWRLHGQRTRHPIPTYAAGFVAGPWHERVVEVGRRRYSFLGTRSRSTQVDALATDLAGVTAGLVEAIERMLRIPSPWVGATYRQAFVPGLAWPGVEDPGCVLLRDGLLTAAAEPGSAGFAQLAAAVAHELAHMWIGNLATIGWWSDLALQEGLAEAIASAALAAIGMSARERAPRAFTVARPRTVADTEEALGLVHTDVYLAEAERVAAVAEHRGPVFWERLGKSIAAHPFGTYDLRSLTADPPAALASAPATVDDWSAIARAVACAELGPQLALDRIIGAIAGPISPGSLGRLMRWTTDVFLPLAGLTPDALTAAEEKLAVELRRLLARTPLGSALADTAARWWVEVAPLPAVSPVLGRRRERLTAVQWAVVERLAGAGELSLVDVEQLAAGDSARRRCGLALLPSAADKTAALDALLDSPTLAPDDLAAVGRRLWHRGHAALADGLVARYRSELPRRTAQVAPHVAARLARAAFPRTAGESVARSMLLPLTADRHVRPAVRTAIADGLCELARTSAYRTRFGLAPPRAAEPVTA